MVEKTVNVCLGLPPLRGEVHGIRFRIARKPIRLSVRIALDSRLIAGGSLDDNGGFTFCIESARSYRRLHGVVMKSPESSTAISLSANALHACGQVHVPILARHASLVTAACASPKSHAPYCGRIYFSRKCDCLLAAFRVLDSHARNNRPRRPRAWLFEK